MINTYRITCIQCSHKDISIIITDGDKGGTPLDWILMHKRMNKKHRNFHVEVTSLEPTNVDLQTENPNAIEIGQGAPIGDSGQTSQGAAKESFLNKS